jgi:hypothetical protein
VGFTEERFSCDEYNSGGLHEKHAVAARNSGTISAVCSSETPVNFYQVIRHHTLSRSAVPFRKFSNCYIGLCLALPPVSAWRCVRSGGPPWHKPLCSNYTPRRFPLPVEICALPSPASLKLILYLDYIQSTLTWYIRPRPLPSTSFPIHNSLHSFWSLHDVVRNETTQRRMVGWLMNCNGFGRKLSWPIRGTIPVFALQNSWCPSRDSKQESHEYESKSLPLR